MTVSSRIARAVLRTLTAGCLFMPASALAPITLQAQATTALVPGEEVRIRWDLGGTSSFAHNYTQVTIAEVMDVSASHLMLRRGTRVFTVPFRSVRSLERRVGTRPASAPRMVVGSGLGFLGGMAFGLIHGEADSSIESSSDFGLSMGVLVGAPIGALIAWATSRERGIYERVGVGDLVSGWTVDPSGRVGLSFRISGR